MAGAIGGVGGGAGISAGAMGGASGVGSAGGVGGGGSKVQAPSSSGKASEVSHSAVVKISDAAVKAMSEPTQEGTNFSVSKDDAGHKYVGGLDQNGFRNPKLSQYEQVAAMGGGNNGGMSDLVAATLLALMQKNQHG